MKLTSLWKSHFRLNRSLPLAVIISLVTITAQAQRITSGHLNVGALGTNAGSQLTFVNGAAFVLNSGYVQMDFATSGTYAGYYGSGPSVTALPQTVAHGGPNPLAPSFGSFVEVNMTLQSAPEGGVFSFWNTGSLVPTFSLDTVGEVSPLWNLSGGEENPTAGSSGADPYGHIHGRRFTATMPGEYIIGFSAFDTSLNGAQHAPSSMLEIRFMAVPEPSSLALLILGGALAGGWLIKRRQTHRILVMKPNPLLILLICISCAAASSSSTKAEIVPARVEKTLTEFVEPPPLDPAILGMMKTNTVGTVEARIYFVESWDIASLQKAQVFVSMLAKSEPDDQRKLAHAVVKQVANTNYALLRQCLCNPKLPRPVLSVFMTDALKRDNRVKMPALLTLAQSDAHPMQAEAQQLLTVYLGQDYGTNWRKWEEAVLAWLERNPK